MLNFDFTFYFITVSDVDVNFANNVTSSSVSAVVTTEWCPAPVASHAVTPVVKSGLIFHIIRATGKRGIG